MRKINLNILIAVCMLMMSLAASAPAATHYVLPGQSIQAAINDANNGDDIEVAPGDYNEAINFGGKKVRLYSSGGPDVTIIDGSGAYHVVQCVSGEDANTILEGFTIKGGIADGSGSNGYGGGMYCSGSSPTVTNCNFTGNKAKNGGGMFNDNSDPNLNDCIFTENTTTGYHGGGMENFNGSNPTVTNCTFTGNVSGSWGGGMYNNNSSPTVTNCIFSGNEANYGGGIFNDNSDPNLNDCDFINNRASNYGGGMENLSSSPTVKNCAFRINLATHGGGMFNNSSSPTVVNCTFIDNSVNYNGGGMENFDGSSPTVTNCTFSSNQANVEGGGMFNDNSSPTVTNCIFWNDSAPDGPEIYGGSPTVSYSDVHGAWSGNGSNNINGNPFFVNVAAEDLRLRSCSPCVDAGSNTAVPVGVTTDLGGNDRFVDDTGMPDTGIGTPPIVDMGAYERQEDTLLFNVRNITQYVNYCSIQAAIDDANNGDVIEVGPGTYDPIDFKSKAIRLYSSCGPEATIIDAGGYVTVVTCKGGQDPNTVLKGFTITGGSAYYGGGMYCENSSPTVTNCIFSGNEANYGGGIFDNNSDPNLNDCDFKNNHAWNYGGGMENLSSSPTVKNCTFRINLATHGGGMFNNNSSPTVVNCTFIENSAGNYHGGGMENYDNSNPTVKNCTFSSNRANVDGGGMFNTLSSSPTVTNCTFSGNLAILGEGGGMRNENTSPTVTNCIFWSDTAPTGPEIYGGSPIVSYSDVHGGWSGNGSNNIDAKPLFVNAAGGDLRLVSYGSPCVDAGDNSVVTEPNDLAGNPRVVDGEEDGNDVVDMGAFEFNGGPVRNLRLNGSYITIQAAIDDPYAVNGDQIEVGPGTYYPIDFDDVNITVYSTDGPSVTVIDAGGYGTAVTCKGGQGPSTVLEGFTMTGGNANGTGEPNDRGGGMYCENSSPTVTGCIFTGNSGRYGGGMCNRAASPVLINCFFNANIANLEGGAILNKENSEPNLTNCSFSGNEANNGGGIYNIGSSTRLTNCILWGDEPNEIFDDPCSTSLVTYSDVQGGWNGEGNIDQNPLLRNVAEGDLSLAPWSPCIDSGNNAVVGPNATDITGLPRMVDGDCNTIVTVDMGAHEFRHAAGGDFDSSCMVNMADFAFLTWAWLASPMSDNWNPICDISIPADGQIDNRDVKVLAGNWLSSIDTPITCEANRLKDEFGLDALCAAAILTAAPCGYSPSDVAHALYDVGYSAAGAYKALTQVCGMTDGFPIEQILYNVGYLPEEYLESTALSFVRKFAPVLYFDQAHKGLPMSAQVYFETVLSPIANSSYAGKITWTTPWNGPCGKLGVECLSGRDECTCGMQNNNFSTLVNGQIPTYYNVISDIDSVEPTGSKGRLRIAYWWFYGFQSPCNMECVAGPFGCGPDGAHHGDWEHIIVTTNTERNRADAVTYYFHGKWYTRLSGGFETEPNDDPQGRPVVYVGRLSHGGWHSNEISCLWEGAAYHCCTYADCRTPDANSIWDAAYQNLVSLRGNSEPWMSADGIGLLYEYYGLEYTISNWRWGPHISYCDNWLFGCLDWGHTYACGTHPTTEQFDWTIDSCDGEGCGIDRCVVPGWFDLYYPSPAYYNQGWPWGGAASSAVESATPAKPATPSTYGSVASCGRCGVSRFAALVQLGNYWLAGAGSEL